MGDVVVTMNVMPEDMEGFDKLKESIMAAMKDTDGLVKTCNIGEQEVAFGMKAIKITLIIPDAEGAPDKLEEKIKSLENVSSVEITSLDRFGV